MEISLFIYIIIINILKTLTIFNLQIELTILKILYLFDSFV